MAALSGEALLAKPGFLAIISRLNIFWSCLAVLTLPIPFHSLIFTLFHNYDPLSSPIPCSLQQGCCCSCREAGRNGPVLWRFLLHHHCDRTWKGITRHYEIPLPLLAPPKMMSEKVEEPAVRERISRVHERWRHYVRPYNWLCRGVQVILVSGEWSGSSQGHGPYPGALASASRVDPPWLPREVTRHLHHLWIFCGCDASTMNGDSAVSNNESRDHDRLRTLNSTALSVNALGWLHHLSRTSCWASSILGCLTHWTSSTPPTLRSLSWHKHLVSEWRRKNWGTTTTMYYPFFVEHGMSCLLCLLVCWRQSGRALPRLPNSMGPKALGAQDQNRDRPRQRRNEPGLLPSEFRLHRSVVCMSSRAPWFIAHDYVYVFINVWEMGDFAK